MEESSSAPVQDGIPDDDVPVQGPIIVVRGAAVVRLSGFQCAADLGDKDRAVFLGGGVLTAASASGPGNGLPVPGWRQK